MDSLFKDYFSKSSGDYRSYRPGYPDRLFEYLFTITDEHKLAWDCATGSGQAALQLATFFDEVVATDASANQIANAVRNPRIDYRVEAADKTSLADSSVNLITVAQALHWFDLEAFTREALRVLKSRGVLAVWTYNLLKINPDVDAVIERLYVTELGPFWPAERKLVEEGYQSIRLPSDALSEMEAPEFNMQAEWDLRHVVGYLNTWSAVKVYEESEGVNPVLKIADELVDAWGDPGSIKEILWPISLGIWHKT